MTEEPYPRPAWMDILDELLEKKKRIIPKQ